MNNLVLLATQEMVIDQYGVDIWDRICEKSDHYPTEQALYSDNKTIMLFQAASDVIGTDIERFIKVLGAYLVGFIGNSNPELFESAGSNYVEFVINLNRVFEQLKDKMPGLIPPRFIVSDLTDDTFVIKYISTQDGMSSLVEGMLIGLGFRFDIDVTVERLKHISEEVSKSIFKVQYSTPDFCQTYI